MFSDLMDCSETWCTRIMIIMGSIDNPIIVFKWHGSTFSNVPLIPAIDRERVSGTRLDW